MSGDKPRYTDEDVATPVATNWFLVARRIEPRSLGIGVATLYLAVAVHFQVIEVFLEQFDPS